MYPIFLKEVHSFLSSLIAYIAIGVFLLVMGLFIWVFPDYSLLDYGYATLDQLFNMAPWIFVFLIPAITMRSFSEERQTGTYELLATRPLRQWEIVLGKFLAAWFLVFLALIPTLLYYYSVHHLGNPVGNLDSGAIWGSYLGLILLGGVFSSIGVFASSISLNQIVAFLLASFLCFFCFFGFLYLSKLPVFYGVLDSFIQMWGIEYHYASISRGLVDTRDVIYFFSVMFFFLALTSFQLTRLRQ